MSATGGRREVKAFLNQFTHLIEELDKPTEIEGQIRELQASKTQLEGEVTILLGNVDAEQRQRANLVAEAQAQAQRIVVKAESDIAAAAIDRQMASELLKQARDEASAIKVSAKAEANDIVLNAQTEAKNVEDGLKEGKQALADVGRQIDEQRKDLNAITEEIGRLRARFQ